MKESGTDKRSSVGVIGLGAMGLPIFINIVGEGFGVTGYDIVPERIDKLVEKGGREGLDPADVARNSEMVLTSLASPEAFQEVFWGRKGLLASDKKGSIVMECSTLALEDKQKAHDDLQDAGMIFLDCPISGGARAAEKDLVVYGSGSADAYRQCLPIVNAFARTNYYLGAVGNGMKMKILANLLVAIHNVSAAEMMVLGKKAGFDPETVLSVMNKSSGRSRMLEVKGARMGESDFLKEANINTLKSGIQKPLKITNRHLLLPELTQIP